MLTPKALFQYLKNEITDMAEGRRKAPDPDVRFTIQEENDKLTITCIQATDEEFAALMVLRKKFMNINHGKFPYTNDTSTIRFGRNREGQEYVAVHTIKSDSVSVNKDGNFYTSQGHMWKNFVYYGGEMIFCKNEMHPNGKLWPCTMKDLFESNLLSQRCFCLLMMEFFSKEHLLWKDLCQDFLAGSAYSSITLPEIWGSHSRGELLKKHYGTSMKRNNRETIGQGIFLIQAARVVRANEIQKLYGFDPGRVYIGRKKEDLVHPLAKYIMQSCPGIECPVSLAHGRSMNIDKVYVEDAIRANISLRRKMSVTFKSPRGIVNWHDESTRVLRYRNVDVVKIPRKSRFRKLKMPENCVRLTTRRQFVEEGEFQHNCVAGYVDSVNKDKCSIWSMRKEDGTRNTIEICCRKSKDKPDGYFFIRQMTAFANSIASEEDYELVRSAISRQKPE